MSVLCWCYVMLCVCYRLYCVKCNVCVGLVYVVVTGIVLYDVYFVCVLLSIIGACYRLLLFVVVCCL